MPSSNACSNTDSESRGVPRSGPSVLPDSSSAGGLTAAQLLPYTPLADTGHRYGMYKTHYSNPLCDDARGQIYKCAPGPWRSLCPFAVGGLRGLTGGGRRAMPVALSE